MNLVALTDTPQWSRYSANPSSEAFADLMGLRGRHPTVELLEALAGLAGTHSDWRVLQHAALAFYSARYATEAYYYAVRAVAESGGHVLAHVAASRALELRRVPQAVLHQLEQIQARLEMLSEQSGMELRVRGYLASAYVRTYCYLDQLELARSWVAELEGNPHSEADAWISLLRAGSANEAADVEWLATQKILFAAPPMTQRDRTRFLVSFRAALLRVLRSRR